ncbi:MAG TPA: restriction endonuclease, SacI family [Pirellulales bacterium]|nr:restriction endonuclease, SacI family [Pirellulales bacterium]
MAAVSIDLEKARKEIERAWTQARHAVPVPSARAIALIETILSSPNVTSKYILVTGLLGKCTDRRVHPRALQTSSRLKHSYDARSLCHKVIVTFEKGKGDLWGLSNEPFVNKPARHPEHDKKNRQLRDKNLAEALHDLLEKANKASANEVFAMLVHALRFSKQRASSQVIAAAEIETTYRRVVEFTTDFLKSSDGGTRLAAVVGAFVMLLNERFTVAVFPPNYSDKFAQTAGDIEIAQGKQRISAFECKHRAIGIDDVRHGIRKAREAGLSEYCFVYAAGFMAGQEDEIAATIAAGAAEIDLQLFDIAAVTPAWAAALNPIRRGRFGETVVNLLREKMHRSEVANQAAELWNRLKQ